MRTEFGAWSVCPLPPPLNPSQLYLFQAQPSLGPDPTISWLPTVSQPPFTPVPKQEVSPARASAGLTGTPAGMVPVLSR